MSNYSPARLGTVGQVYYTWSLQGAMSGFGFVGASPLAKDVAGRIAQVPDAETYPARFELESPPSAIVDHILLTRHVAGRIALIIAKTHQGEDARGRPGRFCNQIFVGDPSQMTVSAVSNLLPSRLVQPRSQPVLRGDQILLPDIAFDELVRPTPLASPWEAIEPLLHRLDVSKWRSLSLKQNDLAHLPSLMALLGANWDRGSDLSMQVAGTEVFWRLTLGNLPSEETETADLDVVVDNPQWNEARKRLSGAASPEDLARLWTGEGVRTGRLPDRAAVLERAVREYANGDGVALHDLLEDSPWSDRVEPREIIESLRSQSLRLSARGPLIEQVNQILLPATYGSDRVDEMDLLPLDRHDMARVARLHLSSSMFIEVAKRNSGGTDRGTTRIISPRVSRDLWNGLEQTLRGSESLRRGAVRTLRAGGADSSGILRTLVDTDPSRVPWALLFDEIVPMVFSQRDAYALIADYEDEFLAWANLPVFYLEVLRRGGGVLRWISRRK